jgi:hypothetical protein
MSAAWPSLPANCGHDVENAFAGAEADVLLESRRAVRARGQTCKGVGKRAREEVCCDRSVRALPAELLHDPAREVGVVERKRAF